METTSNKLFDIASNLSAMQGVIDAFLEYKQPHAKILAYSQAMFAKRELPHVEFLAESTLVREKLFS